MREQQFYHLISNLLKAIAVVVLLALCLGYASPGRAQGPSDLDKIEDALAAETKVRVIVALQPPAATAGREASIQQIEETQDQVSRALSTEEFQVTHTYETLPALAGEVTQAGLDQLLNQPEVAAVALDLPVEAAALGNIDLINADEVWSQLGFTGAGVRVAVLDTGIDANHPDLAGNIIAQQCFNQNGCPPDGLKQSGNAHDENGHGTHVAGIIASRGGQSPRGVASDTGLVAIRVLAANGNGFTSDVLAGLDWVVANQAQLQVKAVNMSLGGGSYTGNCDTANATTQLYAQAVQAARQAGIVIFAASGNSGFTEQMMAPACVSGVMAVGSSYEVSAGGGAGCPTTNAPEQVACYSNSSSELDLLAPGTSILSTLPGGGQGNKTGTSMATAHATGVAALMLQAQPNLTPAEIETALTETGVPITDARNGRITPRLDALAATLQVAGDPVETTLTGTVLLQGRTDHSQTNIFLSQEACLTPLPATGVPTTTTDAAGHFQITLTAGQTYQCLRAVKAGYLVGQRDAIATDAGSITLPGGDITGDGLIDIYDLATAASAYNTNHAQADIDASGQVDILDLAIIATNYKLVGPATWPNP